MWDLELTCELSAIAARWTAPRETRKAAPLSPTEDGYKRAMRRPDTTQDDRHALGDALWCERGRAAKGKLLGTTRSTLECLRAGGWGAPRLRPEQLPMPYFDTPAGRVVSAHAVAIQAQAHSISLSFHNRLRDPWKTIVAWRKSSGRMRRQPHAAQMCSSGWTTSGRQEGPRRGTNRVQRPEWWQKCCCAPSAWIGLGRAHPATEFATVPRWKTKRWSRTLVGASSGLAYLGRRPHGHRARCSARSQYPPRRQSCGDCTCWECLRSTTPPTI